MQRYIFQTHQTLKSNSIPQPHKVLTSKTSHFFFSKNKFKFRASNSKNVTFFFNTFSQQFVSSVIATSKKRRSLHSKGSFCYLDNKNNTQKRKGQILFIYLQYSSHSQWRGTAKSNQTMNYSEFSSPFLPFEKPFLSLAPPKKN